ncbi:DEAD/DEAH box helicase [Xanthovirga aplysinae]|uniref:DEAD/DEAH box helicase n=1 Tax=Xanthovirga aplysinae TaxID=2529853 RepID=UPI0012BB7704|nr:DEAD/DEAH box helicase [Xanthovirga aplysinae]MTI30309.1 DEAD/DEAH box helicase [Xanthovirga aplysinae]
MKFEDYRISPEIKKGLSKLNFKRPTDIQFKAIPSILKGEDVLAIAQTGTGKTAAFAIPILSMLQERKRKGRTNGIKCLVMVPTRELAVQITEVFKQIGQNSRVKAFSVFGGVEQDHQIAKLESGIDILVATPGRMFDLVSQGFIKLHRLEMLVLDEADHMLDLGFIKDIQDLIRLLPKRRQTLFFSATINENIKKLAYKIVHKPIRIQLSPKDPVSKNVEHAVAFVEMDDKRFFLERLVNEHPDSKILAFVRTKVRAERVQKAMERVNIESLTIHGNKEQEKRQKALAAFRQGKINLLIATDVSARGIDIANVAYVVNYDLPDQVENYVHRIGRTGRGKEKGLAISFCSKGEKESINAIEDFIGKKIPRMEIDKNIYQETIEFSKEENKNWQQLMQETDLGFIKGKKGKSKK